MPSRESTSIWRSKDSAISSAKQLTGQEDVTSLGAVVDIAIAVVIVHTQAEHKAYAVPVRFCDGIAAQQVGYRVPALLDWHDQSVTDTVGRQASVTGGDQGTGIVRNGAHLRTDASGEAIIEAAVACCRIFVEVNVIFPDKATDERAGEGGIHEASAQGGETSPTQHLEQNTPRYRMVHTAEHQFPLLPGLVLLPAGAMPPSAGGAAVGSHVGGIRIWRGRLSHLGVFLILCHVLSPSAACTAGGTHIPAPPLCPYYTTERAICQER